MELEHQFDLPVGIDKAWATLLDIKTVGSCFPGAHLDSVNGDEFAGSVKLKAGPVTLTYKGSAKIVDRNDRAHAASIQATGTEGSASTAAMLVTATATELATNRTRVDLVTTLSLTGRPAQFSRAMMVEVGNRLISQFADCVSSKLVGRAAGGAQLIDVENPDEIAAAREAAITGHTAAARPASRTIQRIGSGRELALAGAPASSLLTKIIPAALAVLAVILLRRASNARHQADADPSG
ncbi:MAG: SRPBCC family protein [Actinomycetota bacterium]|nr:SRPBCC family protein [Actinomycetota bacterium]